MKYLVALLIVINQMAQAQNVIGDNIRLKPSTLPNKCNNGDLRTDAAASNVLKICNANTWATTGGLSTTDDLPEGSVNLYFTDERAQDAVGGIFSNGADIHLVYSDGTPSISSTLTNSGVTAGAYGSASSVGTFTVDVKGRLTAAANSVIAITSSAVSDFTEAAQDAVGAMIDSTLVYVDGTPLLTRAALTGDVTASQGSNATTIANDAVTYAKMQNVSATSRVLGRITAGAGDVEELTGANIATIANASFDHGTLTGLSDDDHTQYALLAGRSGGQTLLGGTASGDDLVINSTSHATKGDVNLNASGGNVGLGRAASTTYPVFTRGTILISNQEEEPGAPPSIRVGTDASSKVLMNYDTLGNGINIGDATDPNTSLTFNVGSVGIALFADSASNIAVSHSSPDGKFHIKGTADDEQFIVDGNGTQTANLALFRNSSEANQIVFTGTGGAIFNEAGNDADFRVEGDTDANLLFTDASADKVGIGTSAPESKLHVLSSAAADTDFLIENTNASAQFVAVRMKNTAGEWRFRVSSTDVWQVVDVTNSKSPFSIGPNTPSEALNLTSTDIVFNENGNAVTTRFEGDTQQNLFRIDGADNIMIGGNTAAASVKLGLHLFNGTAPTGSVTDGVVLWGQDTVAGQSNLYARNENGKSEQLTGLADRVSSQFDKTDTTLANVTGLSHNVEAGKAYAFEAVLYTTSNVASGIKAAIAGTATATSVIYESLVLQTGTTVATTASRSTALAGTVCNVTAVTVATCIIKGTIVVNGAGTLTVQFADNAGTNTSSVLVGSTFVLTPIGD